MVSRYVTRALTRSSSVPAAAVAGLTVYDMVKGVTKAARLTDIQLEAKSGGRSGTYARSE